MVGNPEEERLDFSESDFEIDDGDADFEISYADEEVEYPDPTPETELLAVPMEIEGAEEGEITDIPDRCNDHRGLSMLDNQDATCAREFSVLQDAGGVKDLPHRLGMVQTAGEPEESCKGGLVELSKGPLLTGSTGGSLAKLSRRSLKNDRYVTRFVKDTCRRLNEPKHSLFWRALHEVGMEKMQELLLEVDAIEKCGGQVTADGARRRTPGGVLWNILRKRVSADAYKEVMCEERKHQKSRGELLKKQRALSEDDNARAQHPTSRVANAGNCVIGLPAAKPTAVETDVPCIQRGGTGQAHASVSGSAEKSSHGVFKERQNARGGKRKRKDVPRTNGPPVETRTLRQTARVDALLPQLDVDSQPRPRAEWQQAWVQAVQKPKLSQESSSLAIVAHTNHRTSGFGNTDSRQADLENVRLRDIKWANRLVFPSGSDHALLCPVESRLGEGHVSTSIPLASRDRQGVASERLSLSGRLAGRLRMPVDYDDLGESPFDKKNTVIL